MNYTPEQIAAKVGWKQVRPGVWYVDDATEEVLFELPDWYNDLNAVRDHIWPALRARVEKDWGSGVIELEIGGDYTRVIVASTYWDGSDPCAASIAALMEGTAQSQQEPRGRARADSTDA